MSLALALLAEGASLPETKRIAAHLHAAVPETLPLLLIDAGTDETASRTLASLAATSHAQHVPLSRSGCSPGMARGIARRMTGARHVLVLRPDERLVAAALSRLAEWLATHDPDLVLLAGGWWLTEPQAPRSDASSDSTLPYPDAARFAALSAAADPATLRALTPDPRRLLPAEGDPVEVDPFADPATAWDAWDKALLDSRPAVFAEAVLLRALPETGAAAALTEARVRLARAPRTARADLLDQLGPWLGDGLALAPAATVTAADNALQALWSDLPRRLRAQAAALPGPAGEVFAATARGQSLAALALLASARQERLTAALISDHHRLRADLDLALPGPEYLADLYARIRGL